MRKQWNCKLESTQVCIGPRGCLYKTRVVSQFDTYTQSRIKLLEARFINKLVGPSKPNLRRKISYDFF